MPLTGKYLQHTDMQYVMIEYCFVNDTLIPGNI